MVVEVAKALETPRAASTIPMVKIRPGVVEMNHQRGCAGSAGDLDPFGSVDGCASSTVTSYQPSSFRPLNTYALRCTNPDKQILRECSDRWWEADAIDPRDRLHILNPCRATVTDG